MPDPMKPRSYEVTVSDAADRYAMLALQGPDARAILARHIDGEAPPRMRTATASAPRWRCNKARILRKQFFRSRDAEARGF